MYKSIDPPLAVLGTGLPSVGLVLDSFGKTYNYRGVEGGGEKPQIEDIEATSDDDLCFHIRGMY